MSIFRFKHFEVKQSDAAMKVGTDAMVLGATITAENTISALEVGAGTGVVSLMLIQRYPDVFIDAVEIDEPSFKECQYNFQNSTWAANLKVSQADFLDFQSEGKYDLIFANPPYYQTRLENVDAREASAKHERSLPMQQFISKMNSLLTQKGRIWLIIPYEDAMKWLEVFEEKKLYPISLIEIIGKRDAQPNRVILKVAREKTDFSKQEFTIRELDGSYSKEYKTLTKNYHANALR